MQRDMHTCTCSLASSRETYMTRVFSFTVRGSLAPGVWPQCSTQTKVQLNTTPEPCGDCRTDKLLPNTSHIQQNTEHTDRPCLDGVATRAAPAFCAACTRAQSRTAPAASLDDASDAPARAERRARARAHAAGKAPDLLPERSSSGAAASGGRARRPARREAGRSRAISSLDGCGARLSIAEQRVITSSAARIGCSESFASARECEGARASARTAIAAAASSAPAPAETRVSAPGARS